MKRELKKYQKVLIIIALFIVVFGLSFSMLYFFEGAQVTDALQGEDFVYADYIENLDGTYIGEVFDGAFEGEGKFNFVTKEIYNGHWVNSTMSGDGKMLFPEVGTYVGQYSESMRSGTGEFSWENGDNYDGKWSDDKMNGEGVYTFANGNYISGTFENNKIQTGFYCIVTDKYTCEITIEKGAIVNKVDLKFKSGESYKGEISNGKFNGYGVLTYSNGSVYEGDFKDNKKHGTGEYTWQSGECYEGSWENDTMSGYGTYYYESKDLNPKLTGTFFKGKPTGECEYSESYYRTYITTWKNGKCVKVAED